MLPLCRCPMGGLGISAVHRHPVRGSHSNYDSRQCRCRLRLWLPLNVLQRLFLLLTPTPASLWTLLAFPAAARANPLNQPQWQVPLRAPRRRSLWSRLADNQTLQRIPASQNLILSMLLVPPTMLCHKLQSRHFVLTPLPARISQGLGYIYTVCAILAFKLAYVEVGNENGVMRVTCSLMSQQIVYWERLGSLIPACERQVCLADISVKVLWPSSGRRALWPKRQQDKPVFHTLDSENPTFLMTTPVEKPVLKWCTLVAPLYNYNHPLCLVANTK